MIYDGTNGIYFNYGVQVRDQVKFPSAPDIKAVLAEMHEEGGASVPLLFDVSKADRRVLVLPEEWGRQACQVSGSAAAKAQKIRAEWIRAEWKASSAAGERPPPLMRSHFTPAELPKEACIKNLGTSGVATAGYWWGRAGAAIM